jgi:hypothetical protein
MKINEDHEESLKTIETQLNKCVETREIDLVGATLLV